MAYLEAMDSRAENASGCFLTAEDLLWFLNQYIESELDAHNPRSRCRHAICQSYRRRSS